MIRVSLIPPLDDRIRVSLYGRLYSQAALRKYTGAPVGSGRFPSVAEQAGGITQDPPLGYHAIHIIVKNGNVIPTGVVNNEGDATVANMAANQTSGVFSVENDLHIQGSPQKKKAE